jgi:hypothetical protein
MREGLFCKRIFSVQLRKKKKKQKKVKISDHRTSDAVTTAVTAETLDTLKTGSGSFPIAETS